ncbi:hypothetical protein KAR91_87490 [Candidatus Pacearchaeota archaeon]|nr:hypothetical protein [Candidatus Pacearchaeota archaeon]
MINGIGGGILRQRLEARRDGAKALGSDVVGNARSLASDVKERIDLDQNVPKSIMDISVDVVGRVSNLVSSAEKRMATNNRIGLGG